VKTSAGVSEIVALCSVKLTVGPVVTPTPTPVTPVTPVQPLPATGAGALAGMGGLGAIGYASRSYLRSRKSLLDSLRRK